MLLVVLAVVVIVALVWYLRRRRKGAAAAAGKDQSAVGSAPETAIGDEMGRAWRRFVHALPGRARRSLDQFQPVIVLGTESAGKADIVERFSGVNHRRAEIGAPAELTDGDLRLHLGGDIVVMELSEEACRARMDTAGAGLRRAFGPALRRRTPIVVVCLSPESLEKRSEQDLRELGGALSAKIALLADLRGEPLEVRVAVPALPGASRLRALFLLTRLPGVSPVLPLGLGEEPAIRAQLLSFTDLLTEVLATRGPDDALAVVELLEAVPQLSQSLSAFVGELLDGGAKGRIRSGGLYLVPETGGPDPLEIPAALARSLPHPLIKHRLISVTAAAAALVWLVVGYARQAAVWSAASDAAARYDTERGDEAMMRQQIRDYAGGEGTGSPMDLLFPRYFLNGPDTVGCAFVERIRQGPLRDELSDQICRSATKASASLKARCSSATAATPAPPEYLLYVLALLYASHDNDLGTLIEHEDGAWADVILTIPIIHDYLKLAGPNRDVRLLEDLWSYEYPTPEADELGEAKKFLAPLDKEHLSLRNPARLAQSASALRELLNEHGRFEHAAEVVESRAFEQYPLHNYVSVFAPYRPRLELLQELAERRPDLEKVIDTITAGMGGGKDAAPADLPTLVERLGAVLDQKPNGETVHFELGPNVCDVDLTALAKALRDSKAHALVDAFTEGASQDERALLGFRQGEESAEQSLHARWPEGVSSCDALLRPYTRAGFEKSVKPHLLALGKLLAQMNDLVPERKKIEQVVRAAVKRYASDYEASLDQCYGDFHMAALGTAGLKRVLHALSSEGSPLRDFLDDIGQNSTLVLENDKDDFELLEPLRALQAKYEPVAKLVDPGKPGGPLVSYLDLLRDALLRLDPAAAPPAGQASTFVNDLSPLGKLAFESLADPKTAPLEAARAWTQAQRLDEDLSGPFLEPLRRLSDQAVGDLARALSGLNRDLVRSLQTELLSRYPFNSQAADEVDPDQLEDWLNPKRGRVASLRAALGSLIRRDSATYNGPRVWSAAPVCAQDAGCARGLQPLLGTLNDLERVTDLLWTEDGKTQPLRLRVLPHPLPALGNGGPRPVAVRLVAGDGHVDYFNQKPAETLLEMDWTKRQTSTLSVDLASKDPIKSFDPPTLVVSGTPWSLLRLLQKGQSQGATHTWRIPVDQRTAVSISLTVRENATDAFRVGAGRPSRRGSADN